MQIIVCNQQAHITTIISNSTVKLYSSILTNTPLPLHCAQFSQYLLLKYLDDVYYWNIMVRAYTNICVRASTIYIYIYIRILLSIEESTGHVCACTLARWWRHDVEQEERHAICAAPPSGWCTNAKRLMFYYKFLENSIYNSSDPLRWVVAENSIIHVNGVQFSQFEKFIFLEVR